MLHDKIDTMIMASMKQHNAVRTETLRAMKTSFLNWKTAKENVGKTLDEAAEIQILKKMVKQRQDSIEQYTAAGRNDLAVAENAQVEIINEFLPQPVSETDIENAFNFLLEKMEPVKKNMGMFIKEIKAMYPGADGKMVSQIVGKKLQ